MINGRKEEFVALYQQVVQMQRDAMMREAETAHNPPIRCLDIDCFAVVLAFLGDPDLVAFSSASRGCFCAVMSSPVWEQKYKTLQLTTIRDPHQLLVRARRSFLQTIHCFDWSALYIQRRRMHREFIPWVLVVDGGSCALMVSTRRAFLPYDAAGRCKSAAIKWKVKHTSNFYLFQLPGQYGTWLMSSPIHMNQPIGERFVTAWSKSEIDRAAPIVTADGDVKWITLFAPVDQIVDTVMRPMLLVGHPAWFCDEQRAALRTHLAAIFEVFRVPAVQLVHPAVAVAMAFLCSRQRETVEYIDHENRFLVVLNFLGAEFRQTTGSRSSWSRSAPPEAYLSVITEEDNLVARQTLLLPHSSRQAPPFSFKEYLQSAGVPDAALTTVIFPRGELPNNDTIDAAYVSQLLGLPAAVVPIFVSLEQHVEAICGLATSPQFREECYFRWS